MMYIRPGIAIAFNFTLFIFFFISFPQTSRFYYINKSFNLADCHCCASSVRSLESFRRSRSK